MIDWIIEVLSLFKQKNKTIFRAIHLLDLFLKCEKKPLSVKDLHLIGVVCMFVASKLCEVYPLKVERVIRDIGKQKFTKETLLKKELHLMETIKFKLNQSTIFCFSSCLFRISGLPNNCISSIEKYAILLQKMYLFSYDILNVFSYHQLALYSAIISLKLYQHSNPNFSPQKIIYHLIKSSGIPKDNILENLNFLRDFASNFKMNFPFNRIQKTKS
jgi:hypothetical protein